LSSREGNGVNGVPERKGGIMHIKEEEDPVIKAEGS